MAEALHVSGRDAAKTVLLRVADGKEYVVGLLPAKKLVDLHERRGKKQARAVVATIAFAD